MSADVREYRSMDKSAWADGPWQYEPDKLQWVDEATGLDCLIVRNHGGALCGYVGLPEGHPYFQKDYESCDADVHGGLTFADFCDADGDECSSICHVPFEGRPDRVWWVGFDCSHHMDITPTFDALLATLRSSQPRAIPRGSYKTVEYVSAECASLARQLKQVAA